LYRLNENDPALQKTLRVLALRFVTIMLIWLDVIFLKISWKISIDGVVIFRETFTEPAFSVGLIFREN